MQATARAKRDRDPGVVERVRGDVPEVLKASLRQLRDKSLKTRAGVLALLKELLATLPDGQIRDADQLLPGVISAINVRPDAPHCTSSRNTSVACRYFLGARATSEAWDSH